MVPGGFRRFCIASAGLCCALLPGAVTVRAQEPAPSAVDAAAQESAVPPTPAAEPSAAGDPLTPAPSAGPAAPAPGAGGEHGAAPPAADAAQGSVAGPEPSLAPAPATDGPPDAAAPPAREVAGSASPPLTAVGDGEVGSSQAEEGGATAGLSYEVAPKVYDSEFEELLPDRKPAPAKPQSADAQPGAPAEGTAVEPRPAAGAPGPQVDDSALEDVVPPGALPPPAVEPAPAPAARPELPEEVEPPAAAPVEAPPPAAVPPPPAAPVPQIVLEPPAPHWWEQWIREQERWGFDGLAFRGKWGLFGFKIGGRVAGDVGYLSQQPGLDDAYPDFGGFEARLRSAEVHLAGYFGPHIFFKAAFEAQTGGVGVRDVYAVFQDIPYVENLRFGIGKEPFSLEYLTSFRFRDFMERSLMSALLAGRSFGPMIYGNALQRRISWAAGVFYHTTAWNNLEFDRSDGIDVSGRITGLPYFADERHFLHLGVSALGRNNVGDVRLSTRPETFLTDTRFVDTGKVDAQATQSQNVEMAWQRGPLALQGEYTHYRLWRESDDAIYWGGYVAAGWFLTGESRRYNAASGTLGKVVPRRPFMLGEPSGPGALQLAVRWSTVDLDSGTGRGGRQRDTTLALNWYLSEDLRVMVDFTTGYVDALAEGRFRVLQSRLLYSF